MTNVEKLLKDRKKCYNKIRKNKGFMDVGLRIEEPAINQLFADIFDLQEAIINDNKDADINPIWKSKVTLKDGTVIKDILYYEKN